MSEPVGLLYFGHVHPALYGVEYQLVPPRPAAGVFAVSATFLVGNPYVAIAPDGTVTLLFSDMQGFTVMTEALGDLKARDVIREHNQVVREQLAAYGGYEVELQGDGFLLAFSSARQGLYCAIEIQRAFAARNLRQSEIPIHVRIGVHTGEALKDADKFFGRSVILAARIADQAKGGEILTSSIVRELTSSAGDIHFGSEREVELKGIALPQRLVEIDWRPIASATELAAADGNEHGNP